MENNKDIFLNAISKIISLTRDNKLRWSISNPSLVTRKSDEDIIESVYTTRFKDNFLRVYKRRYKRNFMRESPLLSGVVNNTPKMKWYYEIVLELIDNEGNSLWEFPRERILEDLLEIIKFKTSGIEEFIKKLNEE